MRLIRAVVPLVALALTLPAYPAEAAAPDRPSRSVIRDARHDVLRLTDDGDGKSRSTRVPGRRVGDITTVRSIHTASEVVIRTRLAALGRLGQGFAVPAVQLRGPDVYVTAYWLSRAQGGNGLYMYTGDGNDVACPGARRTVRRAQRAIEIALPRTCLGLPSWIRTRVFTLWSVTESRAYADLAPGRRLKIQGALSTRAYAPAGAPAEDSPPPSEPLRVPPAARAVARLLERVG